MDWVKNRLGSKGKYHICYNLDAQWSDINPGKALCGAEFLYKTTTMILNIPPIKSRCLACLKKMMAKKRSALEAIYHAQFSEKAQYDARCKKEPYMVMAGEVVLSAPDTETLFKMYLKEVKKQVRK